jgi:hypothetical protein
MSLAPAREFLLGAYHDLPNVLMMGSLILGGMSGYLPLIWLGIGLVANAGVIQVFQSILTILFDKSDYESMISSGNTFACSIYNQGMTPTAASQKMFVAPSHWLGGSAFFVMFSIYNAIRVALRKPVPGASERMVNVRRAFSMSVLVIGIFFMALVLGRGLSGCETWLGGSLGILIGAGFAIGYWHLLASCNGGRVPDVLQVVNALPPIGGDDTKVPVVCTAPPDPEQAHAQSQPQY